LFIFFRRFLTIELKDTSWVVVAGRLVPVQPPAERRARASPAARKHG
jgi:hypothetical protein